MLNGAALLLLVAVAALPGAAVLKALGLDDFEAWCGGRVAGLVLVTLPAWWLGVVGLAQWRTAGLVVLVGSAGAGVVFLLKARPSWRAILRAEGIFLLGAALVIFLRLDHPQIVYQEKPMDLGIFASLLRSEAFPPLDMWLAGFSLPYYYWGALLWIVPLAASGLSLGYAYNLVVGLIGGSLAALIWAIGRRLGGSHGSGLLAVVFGVYAGTPDGLWQLLGGTSLGAIDPWRSSRQVADTITEFPLFTLWLGDLHPHLLSMPLAALAILVALEAGRRGPNVLHTVALSVVFGVCWAANPWAMPPTLAAVALLLAGSDERWWWPWRGGGGRWLAMLAVAVGGWIVTAPFHLDFDPFFEGLGRVHAWTDPGQLLLWGGCLLIPAGMAALAVTRHLIGSDSESSRAATVAAAAAVVVLAAASRRPTLVMLAIIFVTLVIAMIRVPAGRGRAGLALAALGVFLLAVPELIYVRDSYGDSLHRMNTVFKAYIQAWIFLAAALPVLLQWACRSRVRRAVLIGALAMVATLHPARMVMDQLRADRLSLDGLAWLPEGDRAIIEALRGLDNGTFLIEAVGDAYTEYGRLSAASGVPAYLGWENHEMVWRGAEITPETRQRRELVDSLYSAGDPAEVRRLASTAGVEVVAIGWLERRDFTTADLEAVAAAGETLVDHAGGLLVKITPADTPRVP